MTGRITQRPRARLDLLEQFVYLGEAAGIEVAEGYLAAVEETCGLLARHPRSGVAYDSGVGQMEGLRRARVKKFNNYLLFYLPRAGGIDVVRVLHASRDIESVLGAEEG